MGEVTNMISRMYVWPEWYIDIKTVKYPGLKAATENSFAVDVERCLHIHLGYLRVIVWFGILYKLSVPLLLVPYYIDIFVKLIFS